MRVRLETQLRDDRTVDRGLVHRDSVHEVFVTDFHDGPEGILVATQLPACHAFYGSDPGARRDPTLLAEVFRQACLVAAHATVGVPEDDRILLDALDVGTSPPEGLRPWSRPRPTRLVFSISVRAQRSRSGRVQRMEFAADAHDGTTLAARATCVARVVSTAAYSRMVGDHVRAFDLPSTGRHGVAGSVVGRPHPGDLLLDEIRRTADGLTARLCVDPAHPVLVEHDTDHVPGLALLEIGRQCGHLLGVDTAGGACLHATFHRMVTFDRSADVTAARQGSGATVRVTQDGTAARIGLCGTTCPVLGLALAPSGWLAFPFDRSQHDVTQLVPALDEVSAAV